MKPRFIICILFFFSCHNEHSISNKKIIDLTDCFQAEIRPIPINEIVKRVLYLDLYNQSIDSVLVSRIKHLKVDGEHILISDVNNKVFLFDITGRFNYFVGNLGGGPGEYNDVTDIDLNVSNNEIYIWDSSRGKLYKYNLKSGEFLGEIIIQSFSYKMNFIDNDRYLFYAPEPFNLPERYKLLIYNNLGEVIQKGMPLNQLNIKNTEIRAFPVHLFSRDTSIYIHESRYFKITSYNKYSNVFKEELEYTFSDQIEINLKTDFYDQTYQIAGFISQCIPLNNQYIYFKGVKDNKVIALVYDVINNKCFRIATRKEDFGIFQNPLEAAGKNALYDLLDYGQYYTILNSQGSLIMDEVGQFKNRVFEQVIRIIYL